MAGVQAKRIHVGSLGVYLEAYRAFGTQIEVAARAMPDHVTAAVRFVWVAAAKRDLRAYVCASLQAVVGNWRDLAPTGREHFGPMLEEHIPLICAEALFEDDAGLPDELVLAVLKLAGSLSILSSIPATAEIMPLNRADRRRQRALTGEGHERPWGPIMSPGGGPVSP